MFECIGGVFDFSFGLFTALLQHNIGAESILNQTSSFRRSRAIHSSPTLGLQLIRQRAACRKHGLLHAAYE